MILVRFVVSSISRVRFSFDSGGGLGDDSGRFAAIDCRASAKQTKQSIASAKQTKQSIASAKQTTQFICEREADEAINF